MSDLKEPLLTERRQKTPPIIVENCSEKSTNKAL